MVKVENRLSLEQKRKVNITTALGTWLKQVIIIFCGTENC